MSSKDLIEENTKLLKSKMDSTIDMLNMIIKQISDKVLSSCFNYYGLSGLAPNMPWPTQDQRKNSLAERNRTMSRDSGVIQNKHFPSYNTGGGNSYNFGPNFNMGFESNPRNKKNSKNSLTDTHSNQILNE